MESSVKLHTPLFALLVFGALHTDSALAEQSRKVGEDNFLLHTPPSRLTGLYRSQGMAGDDEPLFFSWRYGRDRADDDHASPEREPAVAISGSAMGRRSKPA